MSVRHPPRSSSTLNCVLRCVFGDLDDVEWSLRLETERLSLRNWTAGFGMARVLRMSDHPARGSVRPESGLTDDDFSPRLGRRRPPAHPARGRRA